MLRAFRFVFGVLIVAASGGLAAPKLVADNLPGPRGNLGGLAVSADGKLVAAAADISTTKDVGGQKTTVVEGSEIHIWDAKTGKLVRTIPAGRTSSAGELEFTPDGKRLVSTGLGIQVWDVATGELVRTLKAKSGNVKLSMIADDNKRFATVSTSFDGAALQLWDIDDEQPKQTIPFPFSREAPTMVGIPGLSSDGKKVVLPVIALKTQSRIAVIDPATGEETGFVGDWKPGARLSTALRPDGKQVAVAEEKQFSVLDAATGKSLAVRKKVAVTRSIFSRDGKTLLSLSNTSGVEIIDPATGRPKGEILSKTGSLYRAAVSADGKVIAVGGGEPNDARIVQVWSNAN